MTIDITELRKVAEAATPGPWERRLYDGVRESKSRIIKAIAPPNEYGYDRVTALADYPSRENAEHIATFQPATESRIMNERITPWNSRSPESIAPSCSSRTSRGSAKPTRSVTLPAFRSRSVVISTAGSRYRGCSSVAPSGMPRCRMSRGGSFRLSSTSRTSHRSAAIEVRSHDA